MDVSGRPKPMQAVVQCSVSRGGTGRIYEVVDVLSYRFADDPSDNSLVV